MQASSYSGSHFSSAPPSGKCGIPCSGLEAICFSLALTYSAVKGHCRGNHPFSERAETSHSTPLTQTNAIMETMAAKGVIGTGPSML